MKKLVALILALAVLVGGWWYVSPLMALDGLRDAAQTGDDAELEERVDFPALRRSVKEQLRTALTDAMESEGSGNPLGAAGAALGLGLVDGIVETLVTPEWLATTITEGQRRQAQAEAVREALPGQETMGPDGAVQPRKAKEPAPDPRREIEWDIEREGLNGFRVTTRSAAGEAGPTLLFARDGLGWDLVGIEMSAAELIPGR